MGNSANIILLPCTLTLYPNPQMRHNFPYTLVTELKLDWTVQTANPKSIYRTSQLPGILQATATWSFQYLSLVSAPGGRHACKCHFHHVWTPAELSECDLSETPRAQLSPEVHFLTKNRSSFRTRWK